MKLILPLQEFSKSFGILHALFIRYSMPERQAVVLSPYPFLEVGKAST
jgi:hypothetical protein